MERIASSSLDFLITSAVATIDVSAIAVDIAPLLILCVCGLIWNFVMLGCLSRFLLPNHWYVRGKPIMLFVLLCTISVALVPSKTSVCAYTPFPTTYTLEWTLLNHETAEQNTETSDVFFSFFLDQRNLKKKNSFQYQRTLGKR